MKGKTIALVVLYGMLAAIPLFAQPRQERPQETTERTIVWWHSNSGLKEQATRALVEAYNDTVGKEEGIHVEAIYQGKANDVLTKTKALLQAGAIEDLPDLAQLDGSAVLDIRDVPSLIPMEDLAQRNGYDPAEILEAARLSTTYRNKMIAMPFNSSTIMLYYDKTAFDEAGIAAPPRTLEELTKISKALEKRDGTGKIVRYGFANVPTTYELIVWLGQQKGLSYITDQRNGHAGIPTKVLFEENGTMVNFLTHWKALSRNGSLANMTSDLNTAFASGKVAMIVASTSSLTTILRLVGDRFEVGAAPFPMVDEQATGGVNVGGGALYAFDNHSKNADAVFSFVRFAVSEPQQLAWHIATGYLPVNVAVYESDAFKKHLEEHPLFGVASGQLLKSNPKLQGLWVPSAYQIYYAFQAGILKMLTEDKSPEETTRDLATEIDGYLDDYLAMVTP